MQKKHGLILLAVGLPLMGMMGCTGLLVVGGIVAASQADDQGQGDRTMANFSQSSGSTAFGGESVVRESGEDEGATMSQGPATFGGLSGGAPMGDSPNYVPSYDAMANTPGTRGFGQYINDTSDIQDNQTGEVSRDVDNGVANPIVESGQASVVNADAPAPAAESAPSGE